MAKSLKVFVSCALDELSDERIALKEVLQNLPLTVNWEFDFTSVASGKVSDEYLERIWDCDVYAILVGRRVPEPVMREYETAIHAEKPCIALIHEETRAPDAADFVRELGRAKPRPRRFQDLEELVYQVRAGFADEFIKNYRRLRLDETEMRELAKQRVEDIAKERQQARDWKGSAIMMGVLILIVVVAIIVGRSNNTPPTIERLVANPSQVVVGGTSVLQVWAYDSEQTELNYEWSATAGSIEAEDATDTSIATFHAPDVPGPVSVRVVVADALGFETESTTEIDVIGE